MARKRERRREANSLSVKTKSRRVGISNRSFKLTPKPKHLLRPQSLPRRSVQLHLLVPLLGQDLDLVVHPSLVGSPLVGVLSGRRVSREFLVGLEESFDLVLVGGERDLDVVRGELPESDEEGGTAVRGKTREGRKVSEGREERAREGKQTNPMSLIDSFGKYFETSEMTGMRRGWNFFCEGRRERR